MRSAIASGNISYEFPGISNACMYQNKSPPPSSPNGVAIEQKAAAEFDPNIAVYWSADISPADRVAGLYTSTVEEVKVGDTIYSRVVMLKRMAIEVDRSTFVQMFPKTEQQLSESERAAARVKAGLDQFDQN